MTPSRTTAVVTAVFFLLAAVTAIVALALYQPVLGDPAYVLGAGADDQVFVGALLELLLAASCIGTAVTLYPVIRRQAHGVALGYVCGRLLEATVIVVGVLGVLSVVTLRQQHAGGAARDDDALVTAASALVALHDWTFLVGPGLVIGVNSFLLASVMYRSSLVPRSIAVLGLGGGPLVLVSSVAVLFGAYEQVSATAMLAAFPVFVWEMSLAGYLLVKGFRPAVTSTAASPVAAVPTPA
jgi:hypothetical protein